MKKRGWAWEGWPELAAFGHFWPLLAIFGRWFWRAPGAEAHSQPAEAIGDSQWDAGRRACNGRESVQNRSKIGPLLTR
jgi:hypothetical protein